MPSSYDISIVRGETFELLLTYNDENGCAYDLSGFTRCDMQGRTAVGEATTTFDWSSTGGTPVITLSASVPNISIVATATATAALTAGSGVYDIRLQASDGTVTFVMSGKYEIVSPVTEVP